MEMTSYVFKDDHVTKKKARRVITVGSSSSSSSEDSEWRQHSSACVCVQLPDVLRAATSPLAAKRRWLAGQPRAPGISSPYRTQCSLSLTRSHFVESRSRRRPLLLPPPRVSLSRLSHLDLHALRLHCLAFLVRAAATRAGIFCRRRCFDRIIRSQGHETRDVCLFSGCYFLFRSERSLFWTYS